MMGWLLFLVPVAVAQDSPGVAQPALALEPIADRQYRFGAPIGPRIEANARRWLLRAPGANPGMLSMFQRRDRQPAPNLVPWAGEFAGKYLISAVQALEMNDDPELQKTAAAVVAALVAAQAEDGYLGPFPKSMRLTAHWDLWGHYHVMLGLMLWHQRTGDPKALEACCRAADLIVKTFLEAGRRIVDVGSDEMNLAVIHGLGQLYRHTRQARYLAMIREIEKDWQRAGDYFRQGLAGVPFFRTPRPRWESLHDLQGLVELYQITGDPRYRAAFLNLWQSIRLWDRHNNGAFSSGEQATGDPFQPSAIETCCTVAWMAITLDALRLAGDPQAADELELSTFNGLAGAQHPSGAWCTYNTPMNGPREASHHTIVFQARAGTPDLNCCSVNGPRGLGMLGQWAVMQAAGTLAVNYLGPMEVRGKLADGTPMALRVEGGYPMQGDVQVLVEPERPADFALQVRIPAWSRGTIEWPGAGPVDAQPGTYARQRRTWRRGDRIRLRLELPLRYEAGDGAMLGRISVYRGPILLAYDQAQNPLDEKDLPPLTPAMLGGGRVQFPPASKEDERIGRFAPWLLVELPAGKGRGLRLCDFATAGADGGNCVSWLPAKELPPPRPVLDQPVDGATVPAGNLLFTWRGALCADPERRFQLRISESAAGTRPLMELDCKGDARRVVSASESDGLRSGVDYSWRVVARNPFGAAESLGPARRFRIDPSLPALGADDLSEYGEGPGGVLVRADLAGDPKPAYGRLVSASGSQAASGLDDEPNGAIRLDGRQGMLVYRLKRFPPREYTASLWFCSEQQEGRLGQVLSAWSRGMDDPLRICVEKGLLYGRIEAGTAYSTAGLPIQSGRWHHVAVVKNGSRWTVYLDGKSAATLTVPAEIRSSASDFALGGNPHYTGASEHLACRVARLRMFCRALSSEEVAGLAKAK